MNNINLNLIGQFLSIITSVIAIYMMTLKSDNKFLFYNTLAAFVSIFQWWCVGATTASVIATIITVRLLLAKYLVKDSDKKIAFNVFTIISLLSCYYTWKNEFSLLPLFSNIVVTYGIYFEKNIKLRIFVLISNISMLFYSVEFSLFAAMITYLIMIILGLLMINKMKKEEIENKKDKENKNN